MFSRALGEFSPDFGLLSNASSHAVILKHSVTVGRFHVKLGKMAWLFLCFVAT